METVVFSLQRVASNLYLYSNNDSPITIVEKELIEYYYNSRKKRKRREPYCKASVKSAFSKSILST